MYERLKQLRIEKGLTQQQIAQELNIATRTYSHYENGDREAPYSILIAICKYFDVTSDYLLGLSDI